jgi:hypothetical protein
MYQNQYLLNNEIKDKKSMENVNINGNDSIWPDNNDIVNKTVSFNSFDYSYNKNSSNILANPKPISTSMHLSVKPINMIISPPSTNPISLSNNNSFLYNQTEEIDSYFKSRINNALNSYDDSNEFIMQKIISNSTNYWSKYALSANNVPEKLILILKNKYSPKSTLSDLKNEDKRKFSILNDMKDKDNNPLFEIYMVSMSKKVIGSADYDGDTNNKITMSNDCTKEEEIEIDTWINNKNQICNEFTGIEVCLLDELLVDENENVEDIEVFNENLGPIFEEYEEFVDESVGSVIYWYSTVSIVFWPTSLDDQVKLGSNFNSKLTDLHSRNIKLETQDFKSSLEKQKEFNKYEESLNVIIRFALLKFTTINDIDIKILCELITNRSHAISILKSIRINNVYSSMRADAVCSLVSKFPWSVLEIDIVALLADSIVNPNFISFSLYLLDMLSKQMESITDYNNLIIQFADRIINTVPIVIVPNFNFPPSSILTMKTLLYFVELFINNEFLLDNNMTLLFFNKFSSSINLRDFNYIINSVDAKLSSSQLPDRVKISRNKSIAQLKILSIHQCEIENFNPIVDVVNMIHNLLFTNEVDLFKRLVLVLNNLNLNIFRSIFSNPSMHQAIHSDPNHPLRVVLKYRCDLLARNDITLQDPSHVVYITNLILWLNYDEALDLLLHQFPNPDVSHIVYVLFDDPNIKSLVQNDENHKLRKILLELIEILQKSNIFPDPLSWENNSISLPDRPEIESFLKSNARTIRMDGFGGVSAARNYIIPPKSSNPLHITNNWSNYSVRVTIGGTGKKVNVVFEKTGDLYIQKKRAYDHRLVELTKLKRLVGAKPQTSFLSLPQTLNFQNIVTNNTNKIPSLPTQDIKSSSSSSQSNNNYNPNDYSYHQQLPHSMKRPKVDKFNLGSLSIDSVDIYNQIEHINNASALALQQQQQNLQLNLSA